MVKLIIIIVNYNTKVLLKQCIGSIYENTHNTDFEIIVIDNNSNDGSVEMLEHDFPKVRIIANNENLGFARANNQGLMEGEGEYFLLLNSDTRVKASAIDIMKDFMDSNSSAGIIGSKVFYPDYRVQGTARSFPSPINAIFGRKSVLTKLFPNNRFSRKYLTCLSDNLTAPFEVDWVSGACFMIRQKVIDDIGLMDEGYWMYWEDADWCYRAKKTGWRIYCVPEAQIIHYEGESSKKDHSRSIISFHKSVYRYYRKHHLKSPLNPLNFIALIGLTVRAGILLSVSFIKRAIL